MPYDARVWREGSVAGVLGAAGVAVWFFLLDITSGTPLATPAMLGRVLFSVLGIADGMSSVAYIAGYSVVHVAAFVLLGIVLSGVVEASKRVPGVLAGLLLLFVIMQVGFFGLTLLFEQSPEWTGLAWYHVTAANLIAAGVMGQYVWRKNPGLALRFAKVLDGRT